MVRVGEDVGVKLDIVPAEFFVHRAHPRQAGVPLPPDPEAGACRG
jgi:hypothetical protein